MSRENVEVVRRALDAFTHRDREGLQDALHPEATWYPALRGLTTRSSYNGPEAICRFMLDELSATLEGYRPEVVALEDLGDAVLSTARFRGQSRSTGLAVGQILFHLYRLSDGKVIDVRGFTTRGAALEAAGLQG